MGICVGLCNVAIYDILWFNPSVLLIIVVTTLLHAGVVQISINLCNYEAQLAVLINMISEFEFTVIKFS